MICSDSLNRHALTLPGILLLAVVASISADGASVVAAVRLPNVFGDNMVVQRDKPVRIWGWAAKGETVTVTFAGQRKIATAGADGRWTVHLDPMKASATGRLLAIQSSIGNRKLKIDNVLVGDVWVLGGQSNMEAALRNIRDGDLEVLSADQPTIRLMTVPLRANPAPLDDFPRIDEYNSWSKVTERKGDWQVCTPKTVQLFSAVGYVFGRRIHQVTKVPVGLIDTSWGGTTVEAWISRDTLRKIPRAAALLKQWDDQIAAYDPKQSLAEQIRRWESRAKRLKAAGKPPGPRPTEPRPSPAVNRNNPGAAYNAIIAPMAGLSVKGALFYQGINNAVGGARPTLYAKTYAALIPEWRRAFGDPKLPFGICQMVSWGFPPKIENTEKAMVSAAPYIRESQLAAHKAHPDTGFVVACDLGHIQMHSPFKTPLGERLARWALATQYGVKVTYRTPLYQSMKTDGKEITVSFDVPIHPIHGGRAEIKGFAIAGADGHFWPATAFMTSANTVKVWSDFVAKPVAVRYAWATHPFGTLVGAGSSGLPAAPFRTDTMAWPDTPLAERNAPEYVEHSKWIGRRRAQAEQWTRERLARQAKAVLAEQDADGK